MHDSQLKGYKKSLKICETVTIYSLQSSERQFFRNPFITSMTDKYMPLEKSKS